MKVLTNVTKEFAEESTKPESVLFTEKNISNVDLEILVEENIKIKSYAEST
jgi:hypothetical protein